MILFNHMTPQERLQAAMAYAMQHRPTVGGFPFLAECLRRARVQKNLWSLPSTQSLYVLQDAVIVQQGVPLVSGVVPVPLFDEAALITALRIDQAGQGTFADFLQAAWAAGVVRYEVDFEQRVVTYSGARDERYVESYPAVEVDVQSFV